LLLANPPIVTKVKADDFPVGLCCNRIRRGR
jgi:hypothetical protein